MLKRKPQPKLLHLGNVDKKNSEYGEAFNEILFSFPDSQWQELKDFCCSFLSNSGGTISQKILNKSFNRFCITSADKNSHVDFISGYRVKLDKVNDMFINESNLIKDIAQLMIPYIYTRIQVPGLLEYHSDKEVSFSRFIMSGYTFCYAPTEDLIFGFLCAAKSSKKNLNMDARIYGFHLRGVLRLLSPFLSQSSQLGVAHIIDKGCFASNSDTHTVESIIKMGLKYPIMFLPLVSFTRKLRWRTCPLMPSEPDVPLLSKRQAIAVSAVAVISDVDAPEKYLINPVASPLLRSVSDECWCRLKEVFGFREALSLISESSLEVTSPTARALLASIEKMEEETLTYLQQTMS